MCAQNSGVGTNLILKALGVALAIVGVVLVANPELASSQPVPEGVFEAIERRVWWGALIGLGVLFMFRHQLRPWLLTITATGAALTFGLLAARLIGIAMDGSVPKQWLWVAVEAVILAGLVLWYGKLRK